MSEQERTDTPASDLYANPQDTAFGTAAAEDQDRVERGEEPAHTEEDAPRPGGKAEPS
ncbi:MAG TPA: hypothetical protein VHF47_03490 [Acidimicrobiales bacterium]|nr:hypothetical protein [Acidimicrobiales bacterium]